MSRLTRTQIEKSVKAKDVFSDKVMAGLLKAIQSDEYEAIERAYLEGEYDTGTSDANLNDIIFTKEAYDFAILAYNMDMHDFIGHFIDGIQSEEEVAEYEAFYDRISIIAYDS